jgi:hypothetical protein
MVVVVRKRQDCRTIPVLDARRSISLGTLFPKGAALTAAPAAARTFDAIGMAAAPAP